MPSIEKHTELSLKRTGKGFKELHEWMEEDKLARHDIANILELLPAVEKLFGKESQKEYLWHIRDDYELNIAWRILRKLRKLKG